PPPNYTLSLHDALPICEIFGIHSVSKEEYKRKVHDDNNKDGDNPQQTLSHDRRIFFERGRGLELFIPCVRVFSQTDWRLNEITVRIDWHELFASLLDLLHPIFKPSNSSNEHYCSCTEPEIRGCINIGVEIASRNRIVHLWRPRQCSECESDSA